MKFFTSRYTASLEAQVADLKQQLAAANEIVKSLVQAQITAPAVTAEQAEKATLNVKPKQRPPVSNFLQSRAILESASAAGLDVEPAEQNGNEAKHG